MCKSLPKFRQSSNRQKITWATFCIDVCSIKRSETGVPKMGYSNKCRLGSKGAIQIKVTPFNKSLTSPPAPPPVWRDIFHFTKHKLFLGFKQGSIVQKGPKNVTWHIDRPPSFPMCYLRTVLWTPSPLECHVLLEWPHYKNSDFFQIIKKSTWLCEFFVVKRGKSNPQLPLMLK